MRNINVLYKYAYHSDQTLIWISVLISLYKAKGDRLFSHRQTVYFYAKDSFKRTYEKKIRSLCQYTNTTYPISKYLWTSNTMLNKPPNTMPGATQVYTKNHFCLITPRLKENRFINLMSANISE